MEGIGVHYLVEAMAPDDLRIVSGETFVDDDGQRCVAVYSFSLDAITFIDAVDEQQLLAKGVSVIESMPSG